MRNLLQRRGYENIEAVLDTGREEGARQKALDIARALAAEGLPPERIAALTGLAPADIEPDRVATA